MYNKIIMTRFLNLKNVGLIKNASGVGEASQNGDIIRIYLKVEDGIIMDAKFKTLGGVVTIVSSDYACDKIKGKKVEDALKITFDQILKDMGELPEYKFYCGILAEKAIHEAIKDYYKKLEKLNSAQ